MRQCLVCFDPLEKGAKKFCKSCSLIRKKEREANWRRLNPTRAKMHYKHYRDRPESKIKHKARVAKFEQQNPGIKRIYTQNRRARIRQNGDTLTLDEWNTIVELQRNRCYDCKEKKPLTIGHAVPVSRGGPTTFENIIAQCLSCNLAQGSSLHPQFISYGSHPLVRDIVKLCKGIDIIECWNTLRKSGL